MIENQMICGMNRTECSGVGNIGSLLLMPNFLLFCEWKIDFRISGLVLQNQSVRSPMSVRAHGVLGFRFEMIPLMEDTPLLQAMLLANRATLIFFQIKMLVLPIKLDQATVNH